jgi:hypothetical protein
MQINLFPHFSHKSIHSPPKCATIVPFPSIPFNFIPNLPNLNPMFFSNSTVGQFISILGSFSGEFFRLLTSSPYSGPLMSSGSARGDYANSVLHFGEREFVVLGFWKMGSGLGG